MILTAKVKNKPAVWSALMKLRVLDVVAAGGVTYVNISGINSVVTDESNFIKISSTGGASIITINKAAGDVDGSDPDFYIDLTDDSMPAFPLNIAVYVSNTGEDEDFTPLSSDLYNPSTKILSGMNSPTDFPDQIVKIITL